MVRANVAEDVLCINYMKLIVFFFFLAQVLLRQSPWIWIPTFSIGRCVLFGWGLGVILYLAKYGKVYLSLHVLLFFHTVLPERPMRGMKKYSLK